MGVKTGYEFECKIIWRELKLPEKLKQWRKANNLAQKQAADIFGVTLRAYQYWESGKTKPANTCIKCVEEKIKQ